jgi:4-hydroxy-2-oxoglutarate aldolase
MDEAESDLAIDTVRGAVPADRPLLAGTGRESTAATIAATRRAAALGVSAVMVRTPSFYKNMMTTPVFVRHYTEVADSSPVPVILYNVTMYTGVTLQADAVAQLSEHRNIVGIKESGNDMLLLGDYLTRSRPGFAVLCGSGTSFFPALAVGVPGAVLALAGLAPEACVEMAALMRAHRVDEARALQQKLLPLARAIGSQHGVPGLKAALDLLGFAGGPPRPPLEPAPAAVLDLLRRELAALGLLEGVRS